MKEARRDVHLPCRFFLLFFSFFLFHSFTQSTERGVVCHSDATGSSDRKDQDPRAKKMNNSKARRGGGPIGDLRKLVQLVKNNDLLPCIVFSFNRRECEHYAMGIQKMDFTNEEEKDAIKQVRSRKPQRGHVFIFLFLFLDKLIKK